MNRNEIDASQTPKFPKTKVVMKLRKPVDKATRIAILEKVKRITPKNPKIYPGCFWLATYINLRPSEPLGILEEDIDRKRGIIRIRDHKTESNNDARYVTLLQEDMVLLKSHPQSLPKLHFFRPDKGNGAAKPGDRFGNSLPYDVWPRACKNPGVKGVPFHPGTLHSSAQTRRDYMGAADIKRLAGAHTTVAFNRYFQRTTPLRGTVLGAAASSNPGFML